MISGSFGNPLDLTLNKALLLVVVVVIEDIARETFHGKLNQESQSFAKISASAFCLSSLDPPTTRPKTFLPITHRERVLSTNLRLPMTKDASSN